MKNALRCITGQSCSSAHVVDGKLILSFPGAITPIVWQMDLAQTKTSALEVRDSADIYTLVLKTPKGETIEVAQFGKKGEAVNGLMTASHALQNAQGQIRSLNPANEDASSFQPTSKKSFSWKTFITGIFLILALLVLWSSLTPPLSGNPQGTASPEGATGPETENGVPLSADEFLRKR